MSTSFTVEQATDIAEDFSDLEATGIIIETSEGSISCTIEKVAVVPFHAADRAVFIDTYSAGKDITDSLEAYKGKEYDVLIIATGNADNRPVTIPIREYTEAYGVLYRYP